MLTVHHLGKSQSERVVWLCEELAIPYRLERYERDSRTILAPPELKALHPMGAAPVITDDGLTLAESGAVVEYVIARYGGGRLAVGPGEANYADYLYWLHFANGSLQPTVMRIMVLLRADVPADNPVLKAMWGRLGKALSAVDARLEKAGFLAGDAFSAADIMIVFTLTTMRYFVPFSLDGYPHILRYLQRIAGRPAYRAAMANGDPGMALLLT